MKLKRDDIEHLIAVPEHISAIAAAVASDLLYGPKRVWLKDGTAESFDEDLVYSYGEYPDDEERQPYLADDWYGMLYTSPAADALSAFIDALPQLYIDEDGCVTDSEPSSDPMDYINEDDEYAVHDAHRRIEIPEYWEIDRRGVVEVLFGRTIAREFR
jgi:hypothetical protein